VGAAGATVEHTSSLLKSLTVIGLTAYRGYTDSRLLNAWAYYFGRSLDMVGTMRMLNPVSPVDH
jgi:hypothetical protein